jgi:hypothetical protein
VARIVGRLASLVGETEKPTDMEPHLNVKRGRKDRPDFGNSERYCQWTSPFDQENQSIAKKETEETEEFNR